MATDPVALLLSVPIERSMCTISVGFLLRILLVGAILAALYFATGKTCRPRSSPTEFGTQLTSANVSRPPPQACVVSKPMTAAASERYLISCRVPDSRLTRNGLIRSLPAHSSCPSGFVICLAASPLRPIRELGHANFNSAVDSCPEWQLRVSR
jgi:hypothetical protein